MSVRRRILAIKLSEKLQKNPEYAEKIGVSVEINRTKDNKEKNSQFASNEIQEGYFMNAIVKGMLLMLLILYVISPVDLCPGPVDDIILILCSVCGKALRSA